MDVREYPIDRKCFAIRLLDIQLHAHVASATIPTPSSVGSTPHGEVVLY
jgi:hypothetical protein